MARGEHARERVKDGGKRKRPTSRGGTAASTRPCVRPPAVLRCLGAAACEALWRAAYVLDDHDQEGQLNAERPVRKVRARDERRRDVGRHDLKHRRLNIVVGDPLAVAVVDLLLPDLQRLGA